MDNFFGDFGPFARIIIAISVFAGALYLLARPGKKQQVSAEEKVKQKTFARLLFGIIVIFALVVIGIFYSNSK